MANMTRDALETEVAGVLGGDVSAFALERLLHLITVTQHATDLLLNEIEGRGELTFMGDMPVVPYMSDHYVETVLTRAGPRIRTH
jgi:hypothetical protein